MTLVTERETKYYEKLILGKIGKLLSHAEGHTREVLDPESGRDYICSVCDMPLKPCTAHPGRLCCIALKGGSELFELEAALDRLRSDEYGICSVCGKGIPKGFLRTHPTTVFCSDCLHLVGLERRSSQQSHRPRDRRQNRKPI
jgi:hypothetical protein